MFVLFVPAWVIYALVIWAVVCGVISIVLHIITYAMYKAICEVEAEKLEDKPSNLIMLHSDETGY